MDSTIKFYDDHADEFRDQTLLVPMEHLYAPFLAHIPDGGRILDAGCGVGRDSKAFLDRGYHVVSFDASERMVTLTTHLTARPAFLMRFQDIDFDGEFDGIWACGSLLHVGRCEIDSVLRRLALALKPSGVLYLSFKYGSGERTKEGRLFNDYDEQTLRVLLAKLPEFEFVSCWKTRDARPGRQGEIWLNTIIQKVRDTQP